MAKIGRPTDYTDDLPEKLFKAMSEGKSVVRFCADINISRKTFYIWVAKHEEFGSTFEQGKDKCEAYWEEWLIPRMDNKDCNSTLVKLFFANRFGWQEKQEIQASVTEKPHEDWVKEYSK